MILPKTVDAIVIRVLFDMLNEAQNRFPDGLPKEELQRVFERHFAWLAGYRYAKRASELDGHEEEPFDIAELNLPDLGLDDPVH